MAQCLGDQSRCTKKSRCESFDAQNSTPYRGAVKIETLFGQEPVLCDTAQFNAKHPLFEFKAPEFSEAVLQRFRRVTHFYVFGMGGSALPLRSLVDFFNLNSKVSVIDSIDPRAYQGCFENPQSLFCFVSKSGETLEVKAMLAEALASGVKHEQMVIVTGPQDSFFRRYSRENSLLNFEIPPEIGGRFTHFISFHLCLLKALRVDVSQIGEGARSQRDELKKDPTLLERLFLQVFCPSVSSLILWSYAEAYAGLSAWTQQVIAESLGKKKKDGSSVGVLPVVLRGPQDQHSVLQLLMEGPQDKVLWFFDSQNDTPDFLDRDLPDSLSFFRTHGLKAVSKILADSTFKSFEERLQNETTAQSLGRFKLTESAYGLGEFICLMDAFVEYSGDRLEINAFDQPGVERGKQIARDMIKELS